MDSSYAEKMYQIMQNFQKIHTSSSKIPGKMSRSELMMLRMIQMNSTETEGVTISFLSERLEISKSAVSQVINALEDKGFVERRSSKSDRRLVRVWLTESGVQCLAEELRSLLQRMADIFAKMGEEDTEEFLRLLKKLYQIVSDDRQRMAN